MKIIFISAIIIFISDFSIGQTINNSAADSLINTLKSGTSLEDFNKILNTNKYVLVDFYADWCLPCKQLAPVIATIAHEMKDKVIVVRINQDNNKSLMDELKVWELPTILIYKNQNIEWTGIGFFGKEIIEEELK
ncbi:hypothetical protein LBMAG27_18220 [Bacteroidota bacterium]|nr:hypothetical protein LBMAG27_18220 [Bacteroidota bacterium]